MSLVVADGIAREAMAPAVNLRPGALERMLVIAMFVIASVESPSKWFIIEADNEIADASNATATLIIMLLTALALMRVFGNGDLWVRVIRLDPRFFTFVGVIGLSVFWSVKPATTLRFSIELVCITTFSCYVVMRYRLREWIVLAALAACAVALINAAFVFGLPSYGVSANGWSGVHTQKNGLGLNSTFEILALLAGASAAPRLRFLFRAFVLLDVVLLVGSQSKTALVALGGVIVMLPVYHGFRARRTLPGAVAASFLVAGGGTLAFVTANLGRITEALGKDITFTGRTAIWRGLLPVIAERPWFGWGFQAVFTGFFSPVHEAYIQAGWQASHAHNAILQTMVEVGIFGTVLYVAAYLRALRRSISLLRTVPGVLGLYPIGLLGLVFLLSITESGVTQGTLGWINFCCIVLTLGRWHEVGLDHADLAKPHMMSAEELRQARQVV